MSLPILVASEKWQEFDDAWSELMVGEGAIEELLQALRLAAAKKRIPRCLPMLREHAEILRAAGRPGDAAHLLGAAVLGGGAPSEIGPALVQCAESAWGEREFWSCYSSVAGLVPPGQDLRRAWQAFERLLDFGAGKLVFHPGGWGTGEILSVSLPTSDLEIRFKNGRTDRIPMSAAVEIFEPLREEDVRAIQFRDPARVKSLLKNEPLHVLRAVIERHDGRATTAAIKNALAQVGVEGGSWAAWWKRARQLAESSEWFRVTGSAAKGEIQLLLKATDPVDDARRRLADLSLVDTLKYVREIFVSGPLEERLAAALLDVLEAKAAGTSSDDSARLGAWMILRERRGATPAGLHQRLQAALAAPPPADATQPPAVWVLFQSLPGIREQESVLPLLQELYGDRWSDEALTHLHHAPSGLIRPLVEALLAAGRHADLAACYGELLSRPMRSPEVLIVLARLVENGRLACSSPQPIQRAQSLLALATYLYIHRRADPATTRTHTRLVDLLTSGREPVLKRLLADADHETLESCQRILQRGVEESIDNLVTDLALRGAPATAGRGLVHFWENDRIWTTRTGRERRSAELKHLREVKIPQNEEALGRAAAMGDLSENFEWSSAIEEQRNLAGRKAQLETELERTELIENAIVAEDTVSPGTRVRYRDLGTSEEHGIEVLGPWDTDDREQVVSYRAPLAGGLLGKHVGDRARITLPSGEIEVEVLEIGPIDFA